MKKMLPILLVVTTFQGAAFAGCPKPVYHLLKGQKAECEGYLFSLDKELELRIMNEDYKFLKQELELKNKQIDNLNKEVILSEEVINKEQQKAELWRNAAETSTKKYIESVDSNSKKEWLYLIGGVLITVAAGYAVGQVSK